MGGEKMDRSEFEQVIKEHEEWLRTKGESGQKADLSPYKGISYWTADNRLIWLNEKAIDFEGINLQNVDLSKAILSGVSLQDANLSEVIFNEADLRGVNFIGANLINVQLQSAHLENSTFIDASLDHVNFEKAHLQNSIFKKTDLA